MARLQARTEVTQQKRKENRKRRMTIDEYSLKRRMSRLRRPTSRRSPKNKLSRSARI
jgi:hypothetical protein